MAGPWGEDGGESRIATRLGRFLLSALALGSSLALLMLAGGASAGAAAGSSGGGFLSADQPQVATTLATLPANFQESIVFSGLDHPTAVRFASDGRVFVAEKSGVIKVFDSLSDTTPTVFADLRTRVRQLLGSRPARAWRSTRTSRPPPTSTCCTPTTRRPAQTAPVWNDACPTPPGATTDGCVVSGRLSRLTASGNTMTAQRAVLIERLVPAVPEPLDRRPPLRRRRRPLRERRRRRELQRRRLRPVRRRRTGARRRRIPAATRRPGRRHGDAADRRGRRAPQPEPSPGAGGRRCSTAPSCGSIPATGTRASRQPAARRAPTRTRAGSSPTDCATRSGSRSGRGRTTSGSATWAGARGRRSTGSRRRPAAVANFGWPCYEGAAHAVRATRARPEPLRPSTPPGRDARPLLHLQPRRERRLGGRLPDRQLVDHRPRVLHGRHLPGRYNGALFFADHSRNCIWVMLPGHGRPARSRQHEPAFVTPAPVPVDLEIGPGGDLFYAGFDDGTIRRIQYFAGNQPPIAAGDRVTDQRRTRR